VLLLKCTFLQGKVSSVLPSTQDVKTSLPSHLALVRSK